MLIHNKAINKVHHKRKLSSYYKARNAWQAIIEAYRNKYPQATIVLPAYIGWSQYDGSGIFDPVSNLNAKYVFYGLDKKLTIDFDNLKQVVTNCSNPIVLLAHYFGFPDPNYHEITSWLDENDIYYIEDSAHAMYSDVIGGSCGRKGAYNIYSLHKMLPFDDGGILVDNQINSLEIADEHYLNIQDVLSYDLKTIYDIRIKNYLFLVGQLKDIKGTTLLYPELNQGVCPQSLPIVLDDYNRDDIYFKMNKQGFGLVSLYHTMIDALKDSTFESASYTSKKIINLPIHQECSFEILTTMADCFKKTLAS